jgi:signal transduction histidine kinase/HAMP domain-containing protein
MRLRIHHPLFAGFLGVIGLLVVLIVLLVGSGVRRELRATFQADIGRHLALGATILSTSSGASADSLARVITRRIGYRVSLISTDGVVLGDSFVDPANLAAVENHLERPEVAAVLRGERTIFVERPSATVGGALLYGARMTTLDGEPVVLRIAAPQDEISSGVARVQRSVAFAGVLAMLVALVAAYALSVAFARPLVALADRARRLTEGDVTSTVPRSRVVELQDVAVAFNRLSDELRARLSELGRERDEMQALIDCMAEGVVALTEDARVQRTNRTARDLLDLPETPPGATIGTLIRHPELRRALEESVERPLPSREIEIGGRHLLLASRPLDQGGSVTTFLDISEIRRLEQVRTDFVANASHELKTPLTSIRGFAEMLVEDDPPDEVRRQFSTAIRNNTLRLQRLVDDLLDLSRLESGGWAAGTEPVDIRDAVEEAWDLVSPQAKPELEFTVEGDGVALGDRQGLVQVFRNLLENALRHTDEGGRVRVRIAAKDAGRLVQVGVTDDGEGIPARALPRIFERFYRADSSRARDFGGTGLGLAIVKHLVGAMAGDVRVVSELGRGTTFTVTLPTERQRDAS